VQKDVEFDRPAAADAGKCTIKAEKTSGKTGWVVRDGGGQVLRNFVDTNADNVVDQWSYYKDGVEVYRDIDSKPFNGKADQYRWLNTAGTRWGVDTDEDGKIDYWKMLSAEELTAEVVAALRDRDPARFDRLLLAPKELKALGLGQAKFEELSAKLKAAPTQFKKLLGTQNVIGAETEWVSLAASRPGTVPAGTDDSSADLQVYENVAAMVRTNKDHNQISVGTLVLVDGAWRLIDSPQFLPENTAEVEPRGIFIKPKSLAGNDPAESGTSRPNEKMQAMMKALEDLDKDSPETPEAQARQNASRADLLEKLADGAENEQDRGQWVRQLADTVSAAVQSGTYAAGVDRLKDLHGRLGAKSEDAELASYVQFRSMTAAYSQSLQKPGVDFAKVQEQWRKDLEDYVAANPKTADSAEALLQLGIAQEFAGEEDNALKAYDNILQNFPKTTAVRKAEGAKRRLESVGKAMQLEGKNLKGKPVSLADFKNKKVVLIQYWATWCEPAKGDLPLLKDLVAKYPGFAVIGVSLDSNEKSLRDYLDENPLPWPQIHDAAGLDGRLANEFGILTLPTMILVDTQGKVANRSVHAAELDAELKAMLKPKQARRPGR